jgi:hypothetical protein
MKINKYFIYEAINDFAFKNVTTGQIIFSCKKTILWVASKQWNSNVSSIKLVENLYVYLLYMCRPLKKIQEWILVCFIWIKYEKEYICQSLICAAV